MDAARLKAEIERAFASERMPPPDQIAPHGCPECREIAAAFGGHAPAMIGEAVMRRHCWDLPLFSAGAKRYFLPAWLLRSIDAPDSDFTSALLMDLDSDHRHEGYAPAQKSVIRAYLEHMVDQVLEDEMEHVVQASTRWT